MNTKTPQNTSSQHLQRIIDKLDPPNTTIEAFVLEAAKNELLARECHQEPTTVRDAIRGNYPRSESDELTETIEEIIES